MTVGELIKELEGMPQNLPVYVEGEAANKVILENCKGNMYVRIFKAWDIGVCRQKVLYRECVNPNGLVIGK